jgi:hypothetical protein
MGFSPVDGASAPLEASTHAGWRLFVPAAVPVAGLAPWEGEPRLIAS